MKQLTPKQQLVTSQIKGMVEVIVKNLVNTPDCVKIKEGERDATYALYIEVAASEIGKVLGRGGQTIECIRKLCFAVAAKNQFRMIIEVED